MTYLIIILIVLILVLLFIGVKKVVVYRSEKGRVKQENKTKILGMFEQKNKITNDEVQELLGVSDATAERYLDELEKQGKIEQIGKTGKHVYYLPR